MGGPQTPYFYDFETFECVPKPQNQYYLFFEPPGYLTQSRTTPDKFQNIMFINFEISELTFCFFAKSWKTLIWDQYLSKSMQWTFGNMDQIAFANRKGLCETRKPRNQETKKPNTKKPNNQETTKTRVQETKKPINQGAKKPRNREAKKPNTKKPRNQETFFIFK